MQSTGHAQLGAVTVDTTAPSPYFNTQIANGGAYWRYSGTSNWLLNSNHQILATGAKIDFSLWLNGTYRSVDVTATALRDSTDTVLVGSYASNYSGYTEIYDVSVPTTPMRPTAGTYYDYWVYFVFKDAAGNTTSTKNTVTGNNNQSFYLSVWGTASPIVLDLNGDGIHTTAMQNSGVMFDVLGNGTPVSTGWTDGKDGLLALDLNGDGKISDGSELFGNGTNTATGKADNGYAALRQYDLNADGVIDAKDAVFAKLQVWVDGDGNGRTEAGELQLLKDLGIASLSLDALSSTKTENGNIHAMTSSWTGTDGKVNDMADVWFANSSLEQLVQSATGSQLLDLDADASANVQDLKLSDVLGLDSHVMVIKAGANDVVNIDRTGWSHSDFTTTFDNHSYNLWNNGNAYALIDQNAQVHQVI